MVPASRAGLDHRHIKRTDKAELERSDHQQNKNITKYFRSEYFSKMADFVNKQFDKAEVAEKVLEQYDQEHTRIFYKYVMGEP